MREWLIRRLQELGPAPVITLDLADYHVLARPGGESYCTDSAGRLVILRAQPGLTEMELHAAVRAARDG